MNENRPSKIWLMRLYFVVLALGCMFFHLLPLSSKPLAWPTPDLLTAFAFVWSVRKPEYVPMILLAVVLLLSDLLLQRPPGLWAVLILLGCQYLKRQSQKLRFTNFAFEWATIAVTLISAVILSRLTLALLLVELPSLGLHLLQMSLTIIVYPLLVFLSWLFLRIRKTTPGEIEITGWRI